MCSGEDGVQITAEVRGHLSPSLSLSHTHTHTHTHTINHLQTDTRSKPKNRDVGTLTLRSLVCSCCAWQLMCRRRKRRTSIASHVQLLRVLKVDCFFFFKKCWTVPLKLQPSIETVHCMCVCVSLAHDNDTHTHCSHMAG